MNCPLYKFLPSAVVLLIPSGSAWAQAPDPRRSRTAAERARASAWDIAPVVQQAERINDRVESTDQAAGKVRGLCIVSLKSSSG